MPIVDNKARESLQRVKHDYHKLSKEELHHIVTAVSYQDAGNYDGKFVGSMASNELFYRSAKRIEFWTMAVAVLSLIVSITSVFISVK